MKLTITIKDIAKIAKVSHTTVSRALNDSPLISIETKERINELAKKLGYVPNMSAKSLVLEKSYNIGLFALKSTENLPSSFFYEIIEGVNSIIGETYNVVLNKFSSMDDVDEKVSRRKYDGILFLSMDISDINAIHKLSSLNIPMVVLNRKVEDSNMCCVYTDEYLGAFNAVEYLLNLGHRRIGIIKGPEVFITSRERYDGYLDALRKHNIFPNEEYAVEGGFTPESGYKAMERLLKVDPHPTAVFTSNDLMAVGALKACNRFGIEVPRDISVIGFDDLDFSKYLIPSLNTVKKSRRAMGREGARILLDLISKKEVETKVHIIESELIIRESCRHIS